MSTKSSIGYYGWTEQKDVHIYKEMLDNDYYIENEAGQRIKLPKEIALLLGEALQNYAKQGEESRN